MTTTLTLDLVIADHIDAINSLDIDAIMDIFAPDALVNDASRGAERIRAWDVAVSQGLQFGLTRPLSVSNPRPGASCRFRVEAMRLLV